MSGWSPPRACWQRPAGTLPALGAQPDDHVDEAEHHVIGPMPWMPVAVATATTGDRDQTPCHHFNHESVGSAVSIAVAVTLGSLPDHRRDRVGTAAGVDMLPDEVLAVVFGYCDARTRMMAISAVSQRWLGVCQLLMRHRAIDLAWAARDGSCAVTDAGLAGLVHRFSSAATVVLTYCGKMTDAGLKAVAAGCPNLQHLDLGHCNSMTDAGLAAVAAACRNLQHLDLGHCGNVSDAGLEAVAAGCPNPNPDYWA